MAHVLGLPLDDGDDVARWCDDITRFFIGGNLEEGERALHSMLLFDAHLAPQIAVRRADRSRDVLSFLTDMLDTETLTDEELLANANLIFDAGYGTTKNLLANACLALLRHPINFISSCATGRSVAPG